MQIWNEIARFLSSSLCKCGSVRKNQSMLENSIAKRDRTFYQYGSMVDYSMGTAFVGILHILRVIL